MPRRLHALARLVLPLLVAGALSGCDKPTPPPPVELHLIFTSQTHGRLTPCGCFSGQFGGISRLKSALLPLASTNTIGLDVGDALEGTSDFHIVRHRHLATAFSSLGYAALNAGRMEASLSASALRQLASQSPVPLISANLLDRSNNQPILPPWKIIEQSGVRIALVGVVDPQGFDDPPGEGLVVERMQTALSRILPEVRRSADLIVLLAHADEATLTALAGEFYEIHLILGGRVRQPAASVIRNNRSLIYYTGNEGKSFGTLRCSTRKGAPLELLENDMILLTDKIAEHPDILAEAAAYRREIRHARLSVDDPEHLAAGHVPGNRNPNGFAGSASCLPCHTEAARVWQSSAHAHAFESLVRRDSDADPACIGCHTIGFGSPGGYRREFGRTQLVDVGCESCHGPGALHVTQRQPGGTPTFKFRPLGASDCRKCHMGEFSRPFDWDRFWPPIQH